MARCKQSLMIPVNKSETGGFVTAQHN